LITHKKVAECGQIKGRVQLLAIIQLEEEPRRGDVARFQKVLETMGYKFRFA